MKVIARTRDAGGNWTLTKEFELGELLARLPEHLPIDVIYEVKYDQNGVPEIIPVGRLGVKLLPIGGGAEDVGPREQETPADEEGARRSERSEGEGEGGSGEGAGNEDLSPPRPKKSRSGRKKKGEVSGPAVEDDDRITIKTESGRELKLPEGTVAKVRDGKVVYVTPTEKKEPPPNPFGFEFFGGRRRETA